MTGSISEVSSESRLRLDMRTQRAAIVSESLTIGTGRREERTTAPGTVMSDTEISLSVGWALAGSAACQPGREARLVGRVRGRMAGQGQEDVVESGAVHGEPLHRAAVRVNLIEQGPYVRGGPVGRHADGQAARLADDRPLAEAARDVLERRAARQRQIQSLRRPPAS